jgi:hypothetical protein
MARDEREEELEFLERLQARTGRDLAQWMAAITLEKFNDKNQAIDWLRAQGFSFQRASWLERIHANGGKPIFGGAPPRSQPQEPARVPVSPKEQAPVATATPPPAAAAAPTVATPPTSPAPRPVPSAPPPASSDALAALEKLISAAKGYRPLYQMLETALRGAIPGLILTPRSGYISLGAPAEFAAVTLHATEVRLGLDLGGRPFDALLQKSKLKGPGAAISHMAVLTDARQVNGELMKLVETANSRVNKQL